MRKSDFQHVIAGLTRKQRTTRDVIAGLTRKQRTTPNVIAGLTRNPQCVIIIALMLFVAWGLLSCNNSATNPNPNRVQNPVRVETTIDAAADTVFEPTGNAELDSLLQLAAVAKQDTNLVRLYRKIAHIYEYQDFEKQKYYIFKGRDLSEQLDYNNGRMWFFNDLPFYYLRTGLPDSAIAVSQKALEWVRTTNNEDWISFINANTGSVYVYIEWYETALQYLFEAMPVFEKKNDPGKLVYLYTTIGEVYRKINLIEKSIIYSEKVCELEPENVFGIVELATAYMVVQQHEKSNHYLEEALRICEQQNNIYVLQAIYDRLSTNSLSLFDLKKAEMYINKAFEFSKSIEDPMGYSSSLSNLGTLEKLRGNFVEAEKHIKESLQTAIEINWLTGQKDCYTTLSELSLAQRNYRQSVQYREKADSVERVEASETALRASEEMAAKYETEKKELEIARQQQVIRSQNLQRGLLAGGIAVAVVILFLLWMMLRLRNRRNKALSERTDALAEMNATKDRFFNIISHDLKNPAISLRDSLKLLADNVRLWDADSLSDFCNELMTSADGQVELLNSLLNWARIQTGRITCSPATFDLVAHLRNDIALVRKMAEKKDVRLVFQMPDDAPVTADANMIVAVVRNLLINAVKFTHAGGTVTLEIGKAPSNSPEGGESPLSFGEGAGVRLISVSDTGVGMTDEQIRNLFRIDRHHSRKGTDGEQGTGLGLIVCKELLDKHNSTLHVESEVGKGSRFWFTV